MSKLLIYFAIACLTSGTISDNPPIGRIFGFNIVSGVTNMVEGPDVPGPTRAVHTYSSNPDWTASIPGANWIWDSPQVTVPGIDQIVNVTNSFFIPGTPAIGILEIGADNEAVVFLNGHSGFCDVGGSWNLYSQVSCDVVQYLVPGINDIRFVVTNYAQPGGNYMSNPAGLLYKLTVEVIAVS